MAEGHRRDGWDRISALLAMQFNCNRGRHPARGPADFNPYTDAQQSALPILPFAELKTIFVDRGLPADLLEQEEGLN